MKRLWCRLFHRKHHRGWTKWGRGSLGDIDRGYTCSLCHEVFWTS